MRWFVFQKEINLNFDTRIDKLDKAKNMALWVDFWSGQNCLVLYIHKIDMFKNASIESSAKNKTINKYLHQTEDINVQGIRLLKLYA